MLRLRFDPFSYDWREYFEELSGLLGIAKGIEELWSEVRRFDRLEFEELDEDVRKHLIMGVDDRGYVERSASMVYAVLLGFRVENIRDLVERMRTNSPLKTKVVVEDTDFMKFLREVSKVLETAIQRYSAVSGKNVDVEVRKVKLENFVDAVVDFVNGIAAKLPNYDERSFFVWSLDQNTFRYLKAVYPGIDSEKGRELMRIFGMERYFEPDVDNEELRREYSFYRFGRGSVGLALVKFFLLVYMAFKQGGIDEWHDEYKLQQAGRSLRLVFPEIPDFFKEFCDKAREALKSAGWTVKFRDIVVASMDEYLTPLRDIECRESEYHNSHDFNFYFKINGIVLSERYNRSGRTIYTRDVSIPLLDLFDCLSPFLFLFSNLGYSLYFTGSNKEYFVLLQHHYGWCFMAW